MAQGDIDIVQRRDGDQAMVAGFLAQQVHHMELVVRVQRR
ncbi:Uncharacterised protein [Bordetella pertussis]|nr:Uncharacterised protein [Bordetella pertussis]